MKNFTYLSQKQHRFCSFFPHSLGFFVHFLAFHVHPFFVQLCYFVILSLLGYLGLKVSKPRTPVRPNDLDLFYTSVSASTVSSMVAVEMEVFSNSQLILLTLLMFVGGEVFTSVLDLIFARYKFTQSVQNKVPTHHSYQTQSEFSPVEHICGLDKNNDNTNPFSPTKKPPINANQIELGLVSIHHSESENHKPSDSKLPDTYLQFLQIKKTKSNINVPKGTVESFNDSDRLKYNCLSFLTFVVLGYLVVVQFVGFSFVSLYITLVPSARQVLKNKGIKIATFSLFTIVSTFASCGFIPTNENMMVFKKNSGLLLLVLPHILLGNTLYPPCLRLVIMALKRVTRREEYSHLLKNFKDVGYDHMLSALHCCLLVATVLGFNLVQFVMFCSVEWNTKIMEGLNVYEKVVASLFQVTNARHSGESVFDLSSISSAILVLFVVMMYLPPYTTFLPVREHENDVKRNEKSVVECLVFSQLSYLVIFIILICITESNSLKEDPLNFNVLNITLEVISAYGNVGLSMGYSCARQLKPDATCKDSWVGFSGRWSSKGKFILILVMFFGRLKKFNMKGGKAWNLS
ncbi:sodium transporter HKT1-like [Glycine soja]|uniref:Putative cation transporter HKT6-like protein n=1 Tax=Glycine soja TaxID=3848 RepID=A0A0B2R7G1_GLYSO|nr:sodium transporter HKT1-like [Glycine soja]KHN28104.1 Putative cation transporter HKT6-like protein [Glycine soja]